VAYFGIGYFDQMQFAWLALLAIICVAVSEAKGPAAPQVQEEVPASACQVDGPINWSVLETIQ
jgi:hypothetical protein